MRNPSKSTKIVHMIEAEFELARNRQKKYQNFSMDFFFSYEELRLEAKPSWWSLIGARDNT